MRRRSLEARKLSFRGCVRLIWRATLRLVAGYGWSVRKIGFGLHDHGTKVELWSEFERQRVSREVPPLDPRNPDLVQFLKSEDR